MCLLFLSRNIEERNGPGQKLRQPAGRWAVAAAPHSCWSPCSPSMADRCDFVDGEALAEARARADEVRRRRWMDRLEQQGGE
jgi:hypothetical protein